MKYGQYEAHPAAELFPMLVEAELGSLAENIKQEGQKEPIVIWESRAQLVDGRNRWRACEIACVTPAIEYQEFADDDEAIRYIVSINLKRRHLDESQRGMVGARLEEVYAKIAKERQRGGQGGVLLPANLPEAKKSEAREEAARDVNVSPRTIQTAKKVLNEATPELIEAVDQGKVSVSAASVLVEATPEEQKEIASKPKEEAKKASVAKAKKIKSEAQHKKRCSDIKKISAANAELEGSLGRFPIVYADPPWRYEHVKTESRAIENQYPTMSLDEIKALPLGDITTPDAVLYLWTTAPKLEEAMEVIRAWGFTYRTSIVWDKVHIGMGYWARIQHEHLLIATKGEPPTPLPENRSPSVIRVQRGDHSAKPIEFYELIERAHPEFSKIELFCRSPREGWKAWGNQSSGVGQ